MQIVGACIKTYLPGNGNMITPHQIKTIHTIKTAAGISDDEYRDMLGAFGVSTSKDMTGAQAIELISKLECIGIAAGTWKPRKKEKRFDKLGFRPGMATPAQLRHLEGLWVSVSRQPTLHEKQASFNVFLNNRFQIGRIEWINEDMVAKIKHTLLSMRKNDVSKNSGEL